MIRIAPLRKWLVTPPLTGGWAAVAATVAIALPTLIRESVDGIVSGVGYSPYLPFVLLTAVLAGWRHATLVALVAATLGDLLFVGPNRLLEGPTNVFGVTFFIVSSALIIVLVQTVRSLAADGPRRQENASGIIFSVEDGHAWASWSGTGPFVRLGAQEEVAEMMKDFLAQLELGKRLNGRPPGN